MRKHILAVSALILSSCNGAFAQTEMADGMRASGKIYVVVVVLATIFAGIFGYLVYLDRKVSKLERKN
jgi:CcmD family protein